MHRGERFEEWNLCLTAHLLNLPNKSGKGGAQLSLVIYYQHIIADQSSILRSLPSAKTIACEQQPRTHHIHGAHNDARLRRIIRPFLIVLILASQGGHADPA